MFPTRLIRTRPQIQLAPRALRGSEGVFWFLLALALALGGRTAADGIATLAGQLSPATLVAAEPATPPRPVRVSMSVSGFEDSYYTPKILPPLSARQIATWDAAHAPMPAQALASAVEPPAGATPDARHPPAIAIVIDDLGPDTARTRRAIALPQTVALSFLPYAGATPQLAVEGAKSGHDILAHVPMQPEGAENPGPMALAINQSPEEMVRRLDWNLARVPGLSGINNHMGSRFTETRAALVPVMRALEDRNLFFFDSLTSPRSQGFQVARNFGVASAARDVFLDDDMSAGAVTEQLQELERVARRQGVALAIGHPHDVTLSALAAWCARLKGYRLVRVRDAIRMKTEREMGIPIAELSEPSPDRR